MNFFSETTNTDKTQMPNFRDSFTAREVCEGVPIQITVLWTGQPQRSQLVHVWRIFSRWSLVMVCLSTADMILTRRVRPLCKWLPRTACFCRDH